LSGKIGRPPFEITDGVCDEAQRLASHGLTLEQIAYSLGICYQTLNEKQKEYPNFSEALKRGKAEGIGKVANALFEKATDGDNVAMIFYLKNRDPENWEELQKRQHAGNIGLTDMSESQLDEKISQLRSEIEQSTKN